MVTFGIAPLAAAFRSGADDRVAALERCLAAAERGKHDRALLWLVPSAQADAEASRARFCAGAPAGPLDGVPVVVKDCIDVAGLPTTNGTRFLMDPVAQDAELVRRLREAGAVGVRQGQPARVRDPADRHQPASRHPGEPLGAGADPARKVERAFGPRLPPRRHG